MRQILIVNQSNVVSNLEVAQAVTAIHKQVWRDFTPAWLEYAQPVLGLDDQTRERIYLVDTLDQANALGYHEELTDIPVGFVGVKTSLDNGDAWTATFSHEFLEQLIDPLINQVVIGPYQSKNALWAFEVCDAVENDEYGIDGVVVSDFVLPGYFSMDNPIGRPVDFLKLLTTPFGLRPGGYSAISTDISNWQQIFGSQPRAHQKQPHQQERRGRREARRQRNLTGKRT